MVVSTIQFHRFLGRCLTILSGLGPDPGLDSPPIPIPIPRMVVAPKPKPCKIAGMTRRWENKNQWLTKRALLKLLKASRVPVESEEVPVMKWEADRRGTFQHKNPEEDMWLVACMTERKEKGRCNRIWIRGGPSNPKFKEICDTIGSISPDDIAANNGGGFVKGQALSKDKISVLRTLGGEERPRFVFRITHEGTRYGKVQPMPFGGLKARGYGKVKTDPMHFQDEVQFHLVWSSRRKTPFISVAITMGLALLFCENYAYHRCQNIKLHIIKTFGEEWDHAKQRMFRVNHLVEKLGLRPRDVYQFECLVENFILESSVVATVTDWKSVPPRWTKHMERLSDRMRWRRQAQEIEKKMRATMKERNQGEKKPKEKIEGLPRSQGFQRVNLKA